MAESLQIKDLMQSFSKPGKVESIILRSAHREECHTVDNVQANTKTGLVGDHYKGSSGKRQVTLIQKEHLIAAGSILGRDPLDPLLTRRNLVVSGINLIALKGRKFRVGTALLEGTDPCHPCSRMEEYFGKGGYNAMRGHGGLCARVLEDGEISIGDEISFVE